MLILIEKRQDDTLVEYALTKVTQIVARPGTVYTVKETETDLPPEDLVLKQDGQDLEVEVDGVPVATIEEFFGPESQILFSTDGSLTPPETALVSGYTLSAPDGDGQVVWQADEGHDSAGWITGILALAGAGGAAAALSSSSGGDPAAGGGPETPDPITYKVIIDAAAGPFTSDVRVQVFDKDGNLMESAVHNFGENSLQVTLSTGYKGPVFVKVIDTNDQGGNTPDYRNETGEPTDLSFDLRAMAMADGTGDIHVIVSPLTELAVRAAGVDETSFTETALAFNTHVGNAFGIEDIVGTSPVTTINADGTKNSGFNPADGLTPGEAYGKVLAQLAGADAMDPVLDGLADAIVVDETGNAGLDSAGQALVTQCAEKYEEKRQEYLEQGGDDLPSFIPEPEPEPEPEPKPDPGGGSTPPPDTTPPVITGVAVPATPMAVGDTVTATITVEDDKGDTYTHVSGSIAGFALDSLQRVDSTTYTARFTIENGGTDVAAGKDIPVNLTIKDNAGNTSTAYTEAIVQAGDPIDANGPKITGISIPDTAMKAGDTVTVTITVEDDGGEVYGNLSGTVGGFDLTHLSRSDSTTYTCEFSVPRGATDIPAADDIPVNITLDDASGSTSAPFSTAISQTGDPIDANGPVLNTVTPADDACGVGLTDNLTLTFSEAVYVGAGKLVIRNLSDNSLVEDIDISTGPVSGWGTKTLTINPVHDFAENTGYYVQFPSGAFLDAAGNGVDALSYKMGWNFSTPDTVSPTILSFSSNNDDGSYKAGDTIGIFATVDEFVKAGSSISVTLDTGKRIELKAHFDGTFLGGTYTVAAGENSADLSITDVSIGWVEDLSGNAMTSTRVPPGKNINDNKAIVVDTIPHTVSGIEISADTGMSGADFITKTASQTISATLDSELASGENLWGSTDGGESWGLITGKVTGTAISWDGAKLTPGTSSIQMRVEDGSGNDGPIASQSYTLDQTGPATTLADIGISGDTGVSAADFHTSTAVQTITATLGTALGDDETLYGSTDGGSSWKNITGKVTGTTVSWDGAELSGTNEIRFKVTDAAGNDGPTASQAYVLDTLAPAVTYTGAAYTAGSDTITLTGTHMETLLDSGEDNTTDIKAKFDWGKFTWDVNGDDAVTGDITFAQTDILSAKVLDGTTLEIILTPAKAGDLEGTGEYDPLTLNDTVQIGAGFSGDRAGNTASTDAFEGPDHAYTGDHAVVTSAGIFADENGDGAKDIGETHELAGTELSDWLGAGDRTVEFDDLPASAINLTGFGAQDKIEISNDFIQNVSTHTKPTNGNYEAMHWYITKHVDRDEITTSDPRNTRDTTYWETNTNSAAFMHLDGTKLYYGTHGNGSKDSLATHLALAENQLIFVP